MLNIGGVLHPDTPIPLNSSRWYNVDNMFPGFLWKRLILPLGILTALSLVLAFLVPSLNGLFVNLATTFLGILLTVCYVDYILRRHDKERWSATTARIESRVQNLAVVTSQSFRTAFHIDASVIHQAVIDVFNPASVRTEILRVIRQELLPRVDAAVPTLNQKDWADLTGQLERIFRRRDQLIISFGNRLDPEVFALLLKIEDDITGIWTMVITFFDVIGVPDHELRAKPPRDVIADKRGMEKVLAKDIKQVLESCASILEWLNKASNS